MVVQFAQDAKILIPVSLADSISNDPPENSARSLILPKPNLVIITLLWRLLWDFKSSAYICNLSKKFFLCLGLLFHNDEPDDNVYVCHEPILKSDTSFVWERPQELLIDRNNG